MVGGLLMNIQARDRFGAVDAARDEFERLRSRASVGAPRSLVAEGRVFLEGGKVAPLARPRRGVDVDTICRNAQVYTDIGENPVDNALELVGTLDTGSAGPGVAAGWASMERLLVGIGEGEHRVVAADRVALLAACSFARAELTTLGYAHARSAEDDLSAVLASAGSNRERSLAVAAHLRSGSPLVLAKIEDHLAEARMRQLLADPRVAIGEIHAYMTAAMRRFYRHRNLVMHWGKTNAVALHACLRTGAPLIGAGLDRIVHAWLTWNMRPLELAARAQLSIQLLTDHNAVDVVDLLER